MEWSILFMGPVGAGKSQAIKTLSDIDVLDTDVDATDDTARLKKQTTVSMDAGVIHLGANDKVRLIGAPGQDRFDFMWDILLEQAKAVVLVLDHSRESRLRDLDHYLDSLKSRLAGRRLPLAIGITHIDEAADNSIAMYQRRVQDREDVFASSVVPVFKMDARERNDVRRLIISVTAMLEMDLRYG